MAQEYVTTSGTLIIPGAYPTVQVQSSATGLSVNGVLMLVGEADAGPDYTLEDDLTVNAFGPDQLSDVVAKYKSGNLVDAFSIACSPANDPDIQGAPNSFILVKTNPSTKASANLTSTADGVYGVLYDQSYGQLGNLIYFTVTQLTAETPPTSGTFTYIPNVGTVDGSVRINGGAELDLSLSGDTTPTAFVAALNALTGITATGGVNRNILAVSGTLAVVVVSGNNITLTRSVNWAVTPTVGDTLVIPAGSAIEGTSNDNVGAYVITSVTPTVIGATKLSDAGKGGAVPGTITAPIAVNATNIAADTDAEAFSPVSFAATSTTIIDGEGKTLEVNSIVGGTDLLIRQLFVLGTTTPVTWVSTSATPALLTSASEYSVSLNDNRQMDNVTEQLSAGGQIALQMGYKGTSCSVTITPTALTTTVAGGAGANLSINLKQYPTLADLVAYISAQPGYSASVGSTSIGRMSPLGLDEGTFAAGTTFGNNTLRIKVDAVKFYMAISQGSALVQFGLTGTPAPAGLPAVMASPTYLSGGAKGGTSDAIFTAALAAIENVQGNFVVPLFSRDATADISDGLTDSSSSYTIANVQAASLTHVLAMSTLKRRRNRQAFLSNRGTFAAAQAAAGTLASYRTSLCFQDVKVATPTAGVVQEQPWMLAALGAGMQAAGFYRAIVHKGINCSGVLQAAKDFKDSSDGDVETALLEGLLIAKKTPTGGFYWVSDQTTYATDANFVYNSIQAVYAADTIALTTSQAMETAFVGQSVADVSAALALAALESIMANLLQLKLIAVSDDAPKGFKNAVIRINGPVMLVSVEIKLAGAIYFIPINFLVSQVTQTASQ